MSYVDQIINYNYGKKKGPNYLLMANLGLALFVLASLIFLIVTIVTMAILH